MRRLFLGALTALLVSFAAPAEARDYVIALPYVAPADAQQGEPAVALGTITDGREHDANWLGAIRGGYGNPLKVLITEGSVADAVGQAVGAGLAARNLAAADGARFRLDIHVVQFDCNQYARKEAHIEIIARLVDAARGDVVYERNTRVDRVEGSVLSLRTGIFASHEELRALANSAMQEAVDTALDEPGLRAALAAAPEVAETATVSAEIAETEDAPPATTP